MYKQEKTVAIVTGLFAHKKCASTISFTTCKETRIVKDSFPYHLKIKDLLIKIFHQSSTNIIVQIKKSLYPFTKQNLLNKVLGFNFDKNVIRQQKVRNILQNLIKNKTTLFSNEKYKIFNPVASPNFNKSMLELDEANFFALRYIRRQQTSFGHR